LDHVAAHVLHGRAKSDARGIGVQPNGARKLNAGLDVRRSRELYATPLCVRKAPKGVGSVVQHVGVAVPMLLVVVPFGQKPELVAAVVEPLVLRRRPVLSCEPWIDEKVGMSVEAHLHQTSAILRDDDELNPLVGDLLRLPPFVVDALDSTRPAYPGSGLRD